MQGVGHLILQHRKNIDCSIRIEFVVKYVPISTQVCTRIYNANEKMANALYTSRRPSITPHPPPLRITGTHLHLSLQRRLQLFPRGADGGTADAASRAALEVLEGDDAGS